MCRMPLWRLYRKNPLASSSEYGQCELDHSGRPLDELFNELVAGWVHHYRHRALQVTASANSPVLEQLGGTPDE